MKKHIRKYDVVLVDLTGAKGHMQTGIRPAVVVQNGYACTFSDNVTIMPLTSVMKNLDLPTHSLIRKGEDNSLAADSVLLGEQMTLVPRHCVMKKIGSIANPADKAEVKRVYLAIFGED